MIDTAALREKVLDLAIRGKLVPQDPTDEPASVLLERIHEQKLQMVREGKLKAKDVKDDTIIFKGDDNCYYEKFSDGTIKNIQDEIPFDLPYGWSWSRISSIGTTNIGLTYKPTDIADEGTIVLRSSNIKNGKIDLTDLVRVKTIIRENQFVEQNDIVICARNGSKALVGKCAIFNLAMSESVSFGAFMAILRTAFYDYVYYFLNTQLFRNILNSDDSKQINQLTQDMLKNTLIPFPPQNEQRKIVTALNEIMHQISSIDNNANAVEHTKEVLKSRILELAIQGKLVPQDENDEPANVLLERIRAERKAKLGKKYVESYIYKGDDNCYYEKVGNTSKKISEEMPFDLPFGWCWITLKEIATITSGKTPKNEQITDLGNIPYFKVGDMNLSGNEIFMEVVQYYVNDCYTGITFPKNSFIFPKNGGALLTNKKRILKQESLVDLNTGVLIPSSAVNNEFMFYLFSTVDFTKNYKGSTIPTIDNEMIGNIVFALPPIEEQSRIVQKIKAIMSILKGGD